MDFYKVTSITLTLEALSFLGLFINFKNFGEVGDFFSSISQTYVDLIFLILVCFFFIFFGSFLRSCCSFSISHNFHQVPGKIIVHTSTLFWILFSSLTFVSVIKSKLGTNHFFAKTLSFFYFSKNPNPFQQKIEISLRCI